MKIKIRLDRGPMRLQTVRIRNFKAIIDSKTVKFGPLTAFIGHNGEGKSSLIEALETYQSIARDGLDIAMQRWLGIEHVRHKALEAKERAGKIVNPIAFELAIGASPSKPTRLEIKVNNDPAANRMFISDERVRFDDGSEMDRGLVSEKMAEHSIGELSSGRSLIIKQIRKDFPEAQHIGQRHMVQVRIALSSRLGGLISPEFLCSLCYPK